MIDINATLQPLILLVDDEPENLNVLADTLKFDYRVAVVTSGEQALRYLENESRPSLILLDIVMPGMDGYELCRLLKNSIQWRDIPVVFITAKTDAESEEAGFQMGAVDYIHKPFNRSIVLSRIRSHLSIHGMMGRLMERASQLEERIGNFDLGYGTTLIPDPDAHLADLLLQTVFTQAMEAVVVTDALGTIEAINPAYSRITGLHDEDVLHKGPEYLRQHYKRMEFDHHIWTSLKQEGHWRGEIMNRRKDGSSYPELRAISSIRGPDNTVKYYVSVFSDITTVKETEFTIDFLTWYDPLTKLPNRAFFLDRLDATLKTCRRNNRLAAILFLDINQFKQINDSLGIQVGDQVLVEFANKLQDLASHFDFLARMDSDEFAFLLPAMRVDDDPERLNHAISQLVETILWHTGAPLPLDEHSIDINTTIGVTLLPHSEKESAFDALRNAKTAHHRAKEIDHAQVVFFETPMGEAVLESFHLGQALKTAIDNNEMRVYLQSQVDQQGQIVGAEALVRWQHPERGLVPPDQFLPLAEQLGLMPDIDRCVILQALAVVSSLKLSDDQPFHLAVNVTPNHFSRGDFVEFIGKALEDSGVSGQHLVIEMTESVMIQDRDEVVNKILRLNGLGVEVSIDDFGTGYSSLSYLQTLPISELKIDRSFCADISPNSAGAVIVDLIYMLAKKLGLRTVIEGVENEEQIEQLARYPEVNFQGYYFARPIPSDEWLAQQSE
ncbi:EAL domain-containing protein [Saccharospirillum mangrovi]|uniref:GGDEF/EAL domain-containing response regulator n=1 Tax=Saccharospirillum mangrovi TaxID=2161747 RepID=UPI000D362BBA|nr:EAL domain-containing protein [Saccharospirillum mangrovi]